MPTVLVFGGDQPLVRCLIGVPISPMVGSIYNMGVWNSVAAAWVKSDVRRTLEGEAVACLSDRGTGLNLDNGGCIGDPHVVAERCLVFCCILHCCLAMGRLQVAFIEARLGDLPKDHAVGVQRACNDVRLGASASPDGEEARALFLTWGELGPLLACAPEDDEWQAMVAMRNLLRDLYSDTPPRADLRAAEVARAQCVHCLKAGCQSIYLFYLKKDVTLAVANAARLGVGLGAEDEGIWAEMVGGDWEGEETVKEDPPAPLRPNYHPPNPKSPKQVTRRAPDGLLSPMTRRMEPAPARPSPATKATPAPKISPPKVGGGGGWCRRGGPKSTSRTPRTRRWAPSPVSTGGKWWSFGWNTWTTPSFTRWPVASSSPPTKMPKNTWTVFARARGKPPPTPHSLRASLTRRLTPCLTPRLTPGQTPRLTPKHKTTPL